MELIDIREYPYGDEPIDGSTGQPVRGRVVRLFAQRTVGMRRRVKNALIALHDGEPEVRTGDSEAARVLAAIHSWEGPGLDNRPLTMEGLDSLPIDSFIDRVFDEVAKRFGDKAETEGKPTSSSLASGASVSVALAERTNGSANGTMPSSLQNGITGRLIKLEPSPTATIEN